MGLASRPTQDAGRLGGIGALEVGRRGLAPGATIHSLSPWRTGVEATVGVDQRDRMRLPSAGPGVRALANAVGRATVGRPSLGSNRRTERHPCRRSSTGLGFGRSSGLRDRVRRGETGNGCPHSTPHAWPRRIAVGSPPGAHRQGRMLRSDIGRVGCARSEESGGAGRYAVDRSHLVTGISDGVPSQLLARLLAGHRQCRMRPIRGIGRRGTLRRRSQSPGDWKQRRCPEPAVRSSTGRTSACPITGISLMSVHRPDPLVSEGEGLRDG